jgi:hypothetical protein
MWNADFAHVQRNVIAGPFPTFEGYPPPPTVSSAPGSNFMTPQTTGTPASGGSGAPALTPAEKTQYTRIFVGVPPEGGLVSGECDTIFAIRR